METKDLERVEVNLRKGQTLIWAANLFHGGCPVRDPNRTRHSQVTHFYFDGCRYYTPFYSDLFLERVRWRDVVNIASGEVVPHFYNGRLVEPPKPQPPPPGIKEQLFHKLKQTSIGCRLAAMRCRMRSGHSG